MLPNENLSCKNLDSLSTELHALYYLKDEYPRSMWWCFGVGEINPCSTKDTILIRFTENFIMGLWYRAVQFFYFLELMVLQNIISFGILVLLHKLLLKFAALCGKTGDNPSHYRNRRACTHACDVGTGCKYWTGGVMYILVWCVVLDRCVELDWCVV